MATTPTSFSDPVYIDEPVHDDDAATGGEVIDLNDPALLAAELDSNVDKNAYDQPTPAPDGFYRVKTKQLFKDILGVKKSFTIKKRPKDGTFYAFTAIEMQIQDPGGQYDGAKVTDNFVSTMVAMNGGIPVVRILQILGVKIPQKVTALWLMENLEKALAGEPDVVVELAWEGNVDQDTQERFKASNLRVPRALTPLGMHKFPDKLDTATGKVTGKSPDMTIESAVLGSVEKFSIRARPRVMGYYPSTHPVSVKK